MSERKKFGEVDLIQSLESIGSKLTKKLRINLIGGCAMTFIAAKIATKDIDVVLRSTEDVKLLVKAMRDAGFDHVRKLGKEYQTLGSWVIMERADGMRFDIFDKQVCGALEISNGMESRARFYKNFGNLDVYLMSPEDIMLFKGITDRKDDLDDMRILIERRINWRIVEKECKSQRDGGKWARALVDKLLELKETHGINSPIIRTIMDFGDMDLLENVFSKVIGSKKMPFKEIAIVVRDKSGYSGSWTRKQLDVLEGRKFLVKERAGKTDVYSLRKKIDTQYHISLQIQHSLKHHFKDI